MRPLSLVLIVVAAAPVVAEAADVAPNVLAGGGLASTNEGYASSHDAFVSIGGGPDALVPVTATTGLACGGHSRQVRLDASGTRDDRGELLVERGYTADGGRLRARISLFARTLGDEASGFVTATGTLRVPGRAHAIACTKTSVDWRAHRLDAAPTGTGPVPGGALMVGTTTGTDQHGPVSPVLLRISTDAKQLLRAKWRVSVPCTGGSDDDLTFSFRPYDLSATGRFVADKHAVDHVGDRTWDTSVRFGGHVGADGGLGYLRVIERASRGGRAIETCDTGKLRWSAVLTPPPAPAPA